MLRLLRRHALKLLLLLGVLALAAITYLVPAVRARAIHYGEHVLVWAGIRQVSTDTGVVYWCPMHPQIKRTKPNEVCPICNMALVELEGGNVEAPDHLTLTARQVQQSGVAIETVRQLAMFREIDATGHIESDERKLAKITSWVRGKSRISKLHVNYTGQYVEQGDVLAELYSPELITAQEEYLIAAEAADRNAAAGNRQRSLLAGSDQRLLESARQNLRFQGMTNPQIDRLHTTREILDRIPIHAPLSGTVIARAVQEGEYVSEGDVLFEIADLSRLWLLVAIYEEELPFVEVGQTAMITVRSLPDKQIEGTIAFIDPTVQPDSRTITVRIDIDNQQQQLKPGMYASVRLRSEVPPTLAVPQNAVLWSGQRHVVIVKQGDGVFQPLEVQLGKKWLYPLEPATPDSSAPFVFGSARQRYHEVRAGLQIGDQVVTSGAFLLNAESQFQSVLTKMLPPGEQSLSLHELIGEQPAEQLRATLDAYYKLSQSLADDQLPQVLPAAERLAQQALSLHESATDAKLEQLARDAQNLHRSANDVLTAPPPDLRAARVAFGRISRNMIVLLEDNGGQALLGDELFVFRCGMANVGYENWIWWSPEKLNPYMGKRMLRCGTQLKTFSADEL